jgi:hypothetical protein
VIFHLYHDGVKEPDDRQGGGPGKQSVGIHG